MALESATYIHQLREDYPTGLDPKSQGDDHIRMVKNTLKKTFPNVKGKVDATHEQINGLTDQGALVPAGCIMMWPFATAIPEGWGECNGITKLKDGRTAPDLRGSFVRAAGGAAGAVNTKGGTATHNHSATVNVAGHALTLAEMPSHDHMYTREGYSGAHGGPSAGGFNNRQRTSASGGNQPHTHAGSTATIAHTSHIPPYYALIYIIKL